MPLVRIVAFVIALAMIAALPAACAPAGSSRSAPSTAGWYVQHGAEATFQPCGDAALRVANGAGLRERAASFGLQDGDPVHVRLSGNRIGGEFRLARIEQFGSPAPVRDCPMTGTMIQR